MNICASDTRAHARMRQWYTCTRTHFRVHRVYLSTKSHRSIHKPATFPMLYTLMKQ